MEGNPEVASAVGPFTETSAAVTAEHPVLETTTICVPTVKPEILKAPLIRVAF